MNVSLEKSVHLLKILWLLSVLSLFFLIAVCDIKSRRVPDRLVLFLAVLGLPGLLYSPVSHLLGTFVLSLPFLILAVLLPGFIGGGDVKLLAAGGWLLGARLLLDGFAFGILSAGVYCIILLLSGHAKRDTKIALAPFLCAGRGRAIF